MPISFLGHARFLIRLLTPFFELEGPFSRSRTPFLPKSIKSSRHPFLHKTLHTHTHTHKHYRDQPQTLPLIKILCNLLYKREYIQPHPNPTPLPLYSKSNSVTKTIYIYLLFKKVTDYFIREWVCKGVWSVYFYYILQNGEILDA